MSPRQALFDICREETPWRGHCRDQHAFQSEAVVAVRPVDELSLELLEVAGEIPRVLRSDRLADAGERPARVVERLEFELKEKSERIEDFGAEVDWPRTGLPTVRSERDRLEAVLAERAFEQESTQRDRDENQSPLDRARRVLSFGE